MKKGVALQHLRVMIWTLQRYRSMANDPLLGLIVPDDTPGLQFTESFVAEHWPWIFGEKCPLEKLVEVVDRAEETGVLAPMDYYNFMTILDRFMPELRVAAAFYEYDLPKEQQLPMDSPTIDILRGWDTDEKGDN